MFAKIKSIGFKPFRINLKGTWQLITTKKVNMVTIIYDGTDLITKSKII